MLRVSSASVHAQKIFNYSGRFWSLRQEGVTVEGQSEIRPAIMPITRRASALDSASIFRILPSRTTRIMTKLPRVVGCEKPVGGIVAGQSQILDAAGQSGFHGQGRCGAEGRFQRCQIVRQVGAPVSMSSTRSTTTWRSSWAIRSRGDLPSS